MKIITQQLADKLPNNHELLSNLTLNPQDYSEIHPILTGVQQLTIYDITIDRKEFISTLEKNLPIYEKNELYEKCAEIVEAIKYLQKRFFQSFSSVANQKG